MTPFWANFGCEGNADVLHTQVKHREEKTTRKWSEARCWKWKHTRVILDGLEECTRCGGNFTPALPSVPRHLLRAIGLLTVSQEPQWTPLTLVLWKIRTWFPHFPPSLNIKLRFLVLGNICRNFRKWFCPYYFRQDCNGIWQTWHKQPLLPHL